MKLMASTAHHRPSLDERVQIATYDSAWPGQAAEEIDRLLAVLGSHVREVEHIGSTAVPGMVAKPIVDLQASVRNAVSALALAPVLRTLGYEDLGEAGVPGRRYFRRRQPPFPTNVHLVWTRTLWRENLTLRDYLRAHPQEADYYGRQKRENLAQGGSTLLVYSDAKAPLLTELVAKARVWEIKRQERRRAEAESAPPSAPQPRALRSGKDSADEARATDAFYAALTAAIRLGDQAGFETSALEEIREEGHRDRGGAEAALARRVALAPEARRKLKFEVEAWQTKVSRLEEARRDFFALAGDLHTVQTKEDLAAWFRRHGMGKDWPLGR